MEQLYTIIGRLYSMCDNASTEIDGLKSKLKQANEQINLLQMQLKKTKDKEEDSGTVQTRVSDR